MQKRNKDTSLGRATTARRASVTRRTKETAISASVDLDGTGAYDIATGIGFLDHMVEQFARHSLIDITLKAEGDLHIDQHHTTEDAGIVLGQAVAKALGDKRGIAPLRLRLSRPWTRPSPVSRSTCRGGRYLVWKVAFTQSKIGEMDTELFRNGSSPSPNMPGITLHVETLYGENSHHIAETCYKALARAIRQAIAIDARKAGRCPRPRASFEERRTCRPNACEWP